VDLELAICVFILFEGSEKFGVDTKWDPEIGVKGEIGRKGFLSEM